MVDPGRLVCTDPGRLTWPDIELRGADRLLILLMGPLEICCGLMLSWLNCWATGEARVGVAKKLFLPPEDPLPVSE